MKEEKECTSGDYFLGACSHDIPCNDIIACFVLGACSHDIPCNDIIACFVLGACSHDRSIDYYVESILEFERNDTFVSDSCDSWDNFQRSSCNKKLRSIQMGESLR